MNRRKFFKFLGIGAAVATAATVGLSQTETPVPFEGTFKGLDGITASTVNGYCEPLTLEDIRRVRQTLISRDVMPYHSGRFTGTVHPFVLKDLQLDEVPEIGGWVSYRFKYTTTMAPMQRYRLTNVGKID